MKYIKTENGILKVDGYDNSGTCVIKTNTYAKTYYKEDYIKMADTIEELCDEFVNVSGVSKEIRITGEYHLVEHSLNIIKGMSGITYGAIWTDKGLIYVAKMNEEGELVLI